mgnify:CR=1 FL=1
MDLHEAFKILEIDLTADKKNIKSAYSKILKKYHPEEFPDLFIQINEAYKKTLEYAENYSRRGKTENENFYNNFQNIEKTRDEYFEDIFEENDEFNKNSKIFQEKQSKENTYSNEKYKSMLDDMSIFDYIEQFGKSNNKFIDAFKILNIKPTNDKHKIKKAYSELLKWYHKNHPEKYEEIFPKINEAYVVALEYEGWNFNDSKFNFMFDPYNSNSNNNNKEKDEEEYSSNYFYSDNPNREKIFNWIKKLELIIRNKIRPLEKYQRLFKIFSIFEKDEKEEILEILREHNILNKNSKTTEFEQIFLNYNLGNLEKITNMLEELPENIQTENLNKIKDKLKSNNKKEVENGYRKFIEDYLNIKFFNLFGINIMLFQKNSKKKTGILFKIIKFIKCEIRKDFRFINELSHIFNIESKKVNYFSEISTELSSFLWTGFLLILVSKFLVRSADNTWTFLKIFTIFISLFDFVNILLEKDFRWSSKTIISNYMFLIINFFFIIILFTVNERYEIQLFFYQYIFLNIILFIKMIITSNIKYKRLKNFSKKILDAFITFNF